MHPTGKREIPRPLRRGIVIEESERFHRLATDPADELARIRSRVERRGVGVLDFTRVVSDLPPPPPASPPGDGEVRRLLAEHFEKRRGIAVDPLSEIIPLTHVEEGFRLLALAFVDAGDVVLIPDPGERSYRAAAVLAGAWPIAVPITRREGYLPDLDRIEPEAWRRTRLLFLSDPNIPTGVSGDESFYERVIRYGHERNVPIAFDATEASAAVTGSVPRGILDFPGGVHVGVEFHELAPLHDFRGWRPGYAVGNRQILSAMEMLRRQVTPPVEPSAEPVFLRALAVDEQAHAAAAGVYAQRRKTALTGIRDLGWEVEGNPCGKSLWIRSPRRLHSMRFAAMLLRRAGIAVVPGLTFGDFGQDFIRIHLTRDEGEIRDALDRIATALPRRWQGGGRGAEKG